MAANKRLKKTTPRGKGRKPNKRGPARERTLKLRARSAARSGGEPLTIPITALNNFIGLFLVPLCLVSTVTFFSLFADAAMDSAFWRSQEFWFFGLGFILWTIAFVGLPRPVALYVFGHEMTHAFFVFLCGGRVEEFSVSKDGGHVLTNKNNLLISLSPYFVPFYTVIVLVLFVVLGIFVDLTQTYTGVFFGYGELKAAWVLFGLVGITWGFHLTFTLWMIWKDQPDLKMHGTFFSGVFIYFVNFTIIAGLLVIASPAITVSAYCTEWVDNLSGGITWVYEMARAIANTFAGGVKAVLGS